MTGGAGIPRTRGGLSGLLLIVLGAWGALVPFVGPYFHYAYTPDRTWAYTSGRLWLEVVPGVAAVVGGLLVLGSRSRPTGGLGAFLAALGGAWFVTGAAVTAQFVKSGSINPGLPVGSSGGAAAASLRQFLEGIGFFTGTGVLIVFFAALALGRFSVAGAASGVADGDLGGAQEPWAAHEGPADPAPDQDSFPASQDQYPAATGQYPPAGGQSSPAGQVPPQQDVFGQQQEQYPPSSGQFPASGPTTSPFPRSGSRTSQFPASQPPDSSEEQF